MAATGIFKNAIKNNVGYGTVNPITSPNGTFTTIYTTPSLKTSYIIGLDVSSTGNTGVQISVRLRDASASANAFLVKDAPIPVGSAIQIIDGQKIVLEAGDYIEIKCETLGETVDVIMSLIEDV